MQTLLEIPAPFNTLNSLCMFHDTIEWHSCGLSLLGKSKETHGDQFVPIVLGKLLKDTGLTLAREIATISTAHACYS